MKKEKKLNRKKILLSLAVILILFPAFLYSQGKPVPKKVPVKKVVPVSEQNTPISDKNIPAEKEESLLKPSIEFNIPLSIPLSGISDLYTLGFGAALSISSEAKWIPYTNIGLLSGYYSYSSSLNGFNSSYTAIPFVLYLEPSYETALGGNDFRARPFAKVGAGASLVSGTTNFGSYSSNDLTIMISAGTGLSHSSFPEGLEMLLSLDYMMLMETEPASMLNINFGVKYRFYGVGKNSGENEGSR